MPVVVAVGCVVNGVVPSSHHRPQVAVDAVVNISSPDSLEEYEGYVGCEMSWHEEEGHNMRHRL